MNTVKITRQTRRSGTAAVHFEKEFETVEFKEGDGATILYYSDRVPATIIEISNDGKVVKVQEDKAIRLDNNGMSDDQEYNIQRDTNGRCHTFKRNSRGEFTDNGKVDYGTKLGFGWREKYYDYSF